MTTITSFNIKHWIDTNCIGGHSLKPETIEAVSGFTLMWNLFEGVECKKHADIDALEKVSEKIAQQVSGLPQVEEGVQFWVARYITDSQFNNLFEDLTFRPRDHRDHVEAVLRGEKKDVKSQVFAVMIIIYRLRNNLFHGIKEINTLNDQVPNLIMSSKLLASILTTSGAYITTPGRRAAGA